MVKQLIRWIQPASALFNVKRYDCAINLSVELIERLLLPLSNSKLQPIMKATCKPHSPTPSTLLQFIQSHSFNLYCTNLLRS